MKIRERHVSKLFLVSSWAALTPLATFYFMGLINSNSEEQVFHDSMILVGMFGFPIALLVSGLFFIRALIAGLSLSTPKMLLLSVLGLIAVMSLIIDFNPLALNVVIPVVIMAFLSTLIVVRTRNKEDIDLGDTKNDN